MTMDPSIYTESWRDEERMNFLFSAFPANHSVNPHHWDSKMSFWSQLIKDMAADNGYAYVSWENLFSQLTHKGRTPLGLQVIFEEMLADGTLVSTVDYTYDIHAGESWVGWGLNWCVKKPVSWMADKVLSPIKTRSGRSVKQGQYILPSTLQAKCNTVREKFYTAQTENHTDFFEGLNVVSYSNLRKLTEDFLKDEESLDLVLATLRKNRVVEIRTLCPERKNGVSGDAHEGSDEKYVKFAKRNEKKVLPFSEVDVGIVRLQQTKAHLEQKIDKASVEITECTNKARECLKKQQKTTAKNALRKRKRLQLGLEKQEQALNNVEQLLENIHQCKTDKMVLDTYRAGVAAYKDLTSSAGLTEAAVLDTMDDVANVMDEHADISTALGGKIGNDSDEDIANLESELASLLEADAGVENGVDALSDELQSLTVNSDALNLPDVPQHSPKRATANAAVAPPVKMPPMAS